jgi:hypothetical protein
LDWLACGCSCGPATDVRLGGASQADDHAELIVKCVMCACGLGGACMCLQESKRVKVSRCLALALRVLGRRASGVARTAPQ